MPAIRQHLYLFLLLWPGLIPGLSAALELQPFTASYSFNIDNKLSGKATRTLEKQNGDNWQYRFNASATMASATETSLFHFDGRRVVPLNYSQQRKILLSRRSAGITFDWTARKAYGQRDGKKAVSYDLPPGTLDTLSMEIQLRRDMKDTGKLGNYWIASPKDIVQQPFVILGEETLNTAAGKFVTLKVSRRHDDPSRHTTFWLAKSLDFLPVKVVQDNDGALYTIELTAYKPGKP